MIEPSTIVLEGDYSSPSFLRLLGEIKMKKVSDLLALSILGMSIWALTSIVGFFVKIGLFCGLIGAIFGIISQSYVLYEKWFRK